MEAWGLASRPRGGVPRRATIMRQGPPPDALTFPLLRTHCSCGDRRGRGRVPVVAPSKPLLALLASGGLAPCTAALSSSSTSTCSVVGTGGRQRRGCACSVSVPCLPQTTAGTPLPLPAHTTCQLWDQRLGQAAEGGIAQQGHGGVCVSPTPLRHCQLLDHCGAGSEGGKGCSTPMLSLNEYVSMVTQHCRYLDVELWAEASNTTCTLQPPITCAWEDLGPFLKEGGGDDVQATSPLFVVVSDHQEGCHGARL